MAFDVLEYLCVHYRSNELSYMHEVDGNKLVITLHYF